eukprot:TRINITY_DN8314_c0_g1_i2.p1 TRINITY_DN8314_c0_g1~~TRINITY_DN8314_c0_g1_i2.p1  ORF type:complete len:812 (-),score=205.03 TRINITY_DN8314_c0_g1_i2:34-2469(-)
MSNNRTRSRSKSTISGAPRFTHEQLQEETEKLRNYFGLEPVEVVQEIYTCGLKKNNTQASNSGNLYLTGPGNFILYRKKGGVFRAEVRQVFFPQNIVSLEKPSETCVHITYETDKKKKKSFVFTNMSEEESTCLFRSLKKRSSSGTTPLHRASNVRNNKVDYDEVQALLDQDPKQLGMYDAQERTPLHIAVDRNDKILFSKMYEVYINNRGILDINQTDSSDYSLLHTACSVKGGVHDEIMEKLLDLEELDVNIKNSAMNIPLHYFCKETGSLRCEQIIDILVKRGCDVNALNMNNESPLHYAILNDRVRLLLLRGLVKHGANTFNLKHSESGEAPLHYAVRLKRLDVAEVIVAAGGDIYLGNKAGLTPLQIATTELENTSPTSPDYEKLLKVIKLFTNFENLLELLDRVGITEKFPLFVKEKAFEPKVLITLDDELIEAIDPDLKVGSKIKLKKEIELMKETFEEDDIVHIPGNQGVVLPNGDSVVDESHVRNFIVIDDDIELNYDDLEFTELLGEGASGQVFKGLYQGSECAIKVLTADNIDSELDEFKKELEILMRVKSEFMIDFFGATITPKLCMVMELCERGSLHGLLNSTKSLPWKDVFSFALDMAEGIALLHETDPPIIHRDLKSLNLLVTNSNRVKVCDFGLARSTAGNMQTFKRLCGTFAYCAPEVFNGGMCTDVSDVFSMGIVIWELMFVAINGRYEQPYQEYNLSFDFQIIVQTARGLRPNIPPGSPDALVQTYLHCVNPDPTQRPSARQVATALAQMNQAFLEDEESIMGDVYSGDVVYTFDPDGPSEKEEEPAAFAGW